MSKQIGKFAPIFEKDGNEFFVLFEAADKPDTESEEYTHDQRQ